MKIEIELSDIESLKMKIQRQAEEIKQLNEKLNLCNPEEIKMDIAANARDMFVGIFSKVAEQLGFLDANVDIDITKLTHRYGGHWYKRRDVEIEFGAHITQEFRRAFIEIGVNPEQFKSESEL